MPFVLTSILIALAAPSDWPNFRGPNHDGIANARLAPNQELPVLWRRTLGDSFSSFAAVNGRIYTCGTVDREQVLFCLDATTGDVVWQKPIESAYRERQGGDGTRATPTVDAGRVYVHGAIGRLVCFDAANGDEIWSREFRNPPTWGYSGSVLIEGDLAIVAPGGPDGGLLALDKTSGQERWKAGKQGAGYATPYPFTHDGRRYIAGFLGRSAILVHAADGRLAAEIPWKTDWDVNAAAPIYHDGSLWIGSGYKTGSALYRLTTQGERLQAEQVWMEPQMLAKFQSPVLYDGALYLSDQTKLKCVDWQSGRELWELRRFDDGKAIKDSTVLIADGRLIVLTEDGELAIGPASTAGFKPEQRARLLDGLCWVVPVIYDGKLYLRDQSNVLCLALAGG